MNKRNSNNDQSSNNTAITTEDIFKKRWQKLHHPTMDVNGDVAFYYGVYKQFYDIAKRGTRNMNEYYLLQLVMLVEDAASVSIGCTYEVMYRSLGKYPNLQYRKDAFLELAGGDNIKAKEMLESDLAFNWCDKEGVTLLSRISESFKMDEDGKKVIANLRTVQPLLLDSYLPLESKDDGRTVTIMKKDNNTLDVIFPVRVSKRKIEDMCFVGQLVTYLGKTYINGPVAWLAKNEFDLWDSDIFWDSIHEDEEEDAKHKFFTTKFGKKYTMHQDLYGEFEKDINGFYTDEPNILDFLNWLASESKMNEHLTRT